MAVDGLKFSRMEGGAEMAAVLRELPAQLQKNALRSTARAGALELQRVSYAYLSLAMKRSAREEDVIIKQRRSEKGEVAAEYVVGPPRRKPWLRWLHNGTRPHTISAVMRHGTRRGALNTPVAPVWLDNGEVRTLRPPAPSGSAARSGTPRRAGSMRLWSRWPCSGIRPRSR